MAKQTRPVRYVLPALFYEMSQGYRFAPSNVSASLRPIFGRLLQAHTLTIFFVFLCLKDAVSVDPPYSALIFMTDGKVF